MLEVLSFDDVLIVPKFSAIKSRKDVSLKTIIGSSSLRLPVISSNMDTITNDVMASAMTLAGGVGCLHRFQSIEDNVEQFQASPTDTWVSIGLGDSELNRGKALFRAGARTIVIDVAHGASTETIKQYNLLREFTHVSCDIIVGNFATKEEINTFLARTLYVPAAFKIGIGGGSACTTRIKTGCGLPTLASILDCAITGQTLIADGGLRTSGDIAKALAAGASAVMLGGMLAGTDETPGKILNNKGSNYNDPTSACGDGKLYKKYRGSASKESYMVQGKALNGRTAEGESFLVPYKGSVTNVLNDIDGGLRSAFSYVNANNLTEFQENATLVKVTGNGVLENKAHGKKE